MASKLLSSTTYVPRKSETMSFSKFAQIAKSDMSNVKSSQIIMPKIGSRSLGHVLVEYNTPVLQQVG